MQDSQSSLSFKFTAAYRLLRRDGFEHVIRAGNIADSQFKIFFVPNQGKNARLGIIASKKKLPNAVDRNRVKRIIRDKFRQHKIKRCKLDVVVMLKNGCGQGADTRFDNLERLFSQVEDRCVEWSLR